MQFSAKLSTLTLAIALAHCSFALAADAPQPSATFDSHVEFGAAHGHTKLKQAPPPRKPQALPPSLEQIKYNLPESSKPRLDLMPKNSKQALSKQALSTSAANNTLGTTPECQDMNKLATYGGAALADYIVNLPSYECHYGLFSLSASQAATVFSAANFDAVAKRFVSEAANYNASDMKLVNLLIYLRAGYYLAGNNVMPQPAANLITQMRPAIAAMIHANKINKPKSFAPRTAVCL
jgi:microbial collagenase